MPRPVSYARTPFWLRRLRGASLVALGLGLAALALPRSATAQAIAVEPEVQRLPEPPREEGGGTGYFSIGGGASVAQLFGRPLVGGALQLEGGAMLSRKLGLGAFARFEGGQLDLRYLPVGSLRIGFLVIGVLHERVTISGALGPGVLIAIRNTNRSWMMSGLAALDVTLGIDLYTPRRELGRPGGSLYLPITASALLLSQVRDGLPLAFMGLLGLGYRYR